MSVKNPTLAQLMAAKGYRPDQISDPRVQRFIAKQQGADWKRIQHLIHKRKRRKP